MERKQPPPGICPSIVHSPNELLLTKIENRMKNGDTGDVACLNSEETDETTTTM